MSNKTTLRSLGVIASIFLGGLLVSGVQTSASASQTGCTVHNGVERYCSDRFIDAAKNVLRSEPDDYRDRDQTVGEALRDCMQCASDAIRSGMDEISGNSSGGN